MCSLYTNVSHSRVVTARFAIYENINCLSAYVNNHNSSGQQYIVVAVYMDR
jgi:hypothetical protein